MKRHANGFEKLAAHLIQGIVILLIFAVIAGWLLMPKVLQQEVTLVADDGHSLPFAAIVVNSRKGEIHQRTDGSGKTEIPRFGKFSVSVNDPRYLDKTWQAEEIEPQLVVQRSLLGAGLDGLADKLLKPAKEK